MSDGYRRAALALHGLARADRRWLLAQLDPGQRSRLDGLLAELTRLGARFDADDLAALTGETGSADGSPAASPSEPAQPRPVADALASAPLPALTALLADEPDGVLAALLVDASEAGRERLREAAGDERCRRAAALRREAASLGEASRAALRTALLDRLAAAVPGGAGDAVPVDASAVAPARRARR